MTLTRKNEILTKVSKLLDDLLEVDEINISERKEKTPIPMEMLTIKECTEAVKGLNEYTVRQLVARNAIPYVRAGQGKRGKVLIPKSALVEYFSGNTF